MREYRLQPATETISQEVMGKARVLAKYLKENETGRSLTLDVNGKKVQATAYASSGGLVIVTSSVLAFADLNPQTNEPVIQKYIPFE